MRAFPKLVAVGALLIAGCDLNPQPLPPGDTPSDAGTYSPGAGGSTGSSDAAPPKVSDAGGVPLPPAGDAGSDAAAGDGGTDAADGGDAGDAGTDGGGGDGDAGDAGDGGDSAPQRT